MRTISSAEGRFVRASGPSRERVEEASSSGVNTAVKPKVRGSTIRTSAPASVLAATRMWVASGPPGRATDIRPDMPRWTTQVFPPSSSNMRNLPLRPSDRTSRPSRRFRKSAGSGWRRSILARRTSAETIFRPDSASSRPRLVDSTSGSSGNYPPSSWPQAAADPRAPPAGSSRARRAAACSASRLERPMPLPRSTPSTNTAAVKSFSWSGPLSATR